MATYERVLRLVADTPWAIRPHVLAMIVDFLSIRAAGEQLTPAEVRERIGAGPARRLPERRGAVAVLPVYGVIAPKATMMTEMSGGTSLGAFRQAFSAALQDDRVGGILLDIDSPGGMVEGVPEAAAEIRAARGAKPIIAVANATAASAAYWLGSQADEFYVTPSGQVGSIGVFTAHDDLSRADEMRGIKTTLISAGRFKTEGNPFEPLSEEAREAAQRTVDEFYAMFVDDVAAGRDTTPEAVRNGYGEGRMVTASTAVVEGMADGVATFEEVLGRFTTGEFTSRTTTGNLGSITFNIPAWPIEDHDPEPEPEPEEEGHIGVDIAARRVGVRRTRLRQAAQEGRRQR